MQFKLPTSLSDGITFPHHQIQAPGSFALVPENRLHFKLLDTCALGPIGAPETNIGPNGGIPKRQEQLHGTLISLYVTKRM